MAERDRPDTFNEERGNLGEINKMSWTLDANGNNMKTLLSMLHDEWNKTNVARPVMFQSRNKDLPTKRDLDQNDKLGVYRIPGKLYAKADIYHTGQSWTELIALDIRTARNEPQIDKLVTELRRVLNANRKNPTDSDSTPLPFKEILPVAERDLSDGDKGFYRVVYEVRLIKAFELVT